jgi:hypothetical protein
MKKGTYYFSHDYNARNDDKIKALIRKHKMVGYGIYWAIIEDLYNNANALRMDCEGIAFDLRANVEVVKSVLNDFDLFIISDQIISSLSVKKRLEKRTEKSVKAKESALVRWGENANALRPQSECNAIKERKGKEKKGNIKQFEPPTFEEFKKYCEESGYSGIAERAFKGYAEANPPWTDTKGNKIRSWKQKLQNVWFREENKNKSNNLNLNQNHL